MNQRNMSGKEREAYKRAQRRKQRMAQSRGKKPAGVNLAKSVNKNKNRSKRKGSSRRRTSKLSRNVGISLCGIQLVLSIIFIVALFVLDIAPAKYMTIVIGILLLLWLLPLSNQLISKKRAVVGKVVSILLSISLVVGSFYVFKTNGTIKNIAGGDKKVDRVVVAVRLDDSAKNIKDAADYKFGVQYAVKGEEIKDTVEDINKEVGKDIDTQEYPTLNEQVEALYQNNVRAIIYNEAYMAILEESFPGFKDKVRVIYTHEITSKLKNEVADVKVDEDSFIVYISGIDVYGPIETNSRSDVNIMAVVNPNTHQLLLVTTPRDYYVEIPGISGTQKDKLTHAGIYGVDASMNTLAKLYDTDIHFYTRVNFTSLVQMVDSLGGVTVTSTQSFTTSDESGLVMDVNEGENYFSGSQVLAFSRERLNVDGGDFQRGRNQQAVITGMIKKAMSPAILTGASGILSSISGNMDTNMSQDQIQELIRGQLESGASWSIKSMSAEGVGDQQETYSAIGSTLYVTQPDQNSINAIKEAIRIVRAGEILPDAEVAQ